MNVHSLTFAGYVGLILIFYYLLPRRIQNYWLLATSYLFYLTWAWQFPLVLAGLTLLNFFLAQRLESLPRSNKGWLWAGIGLNVLALAFFKYAEFFVPELISFLTRWGFRPWTSTLQIILPIGLSFYTLQAISYLIDVHRRQTPASRNLVDFALYLAYFPKLTAGPIEHARTFLPKLTQPRVVNNALLTRSFCLIVIGLVRKVVLADPLLQAIPFQLFETPLIAFSAIELSAWWLVYAFGLYNDFAGYTSIVRGVSGLFGLELSRNFAHPFFARSFTEFWNRWHITLSHWLRDYIYFPLNRALLRRNLGQYNWASLIAPPLVTMLASGLWHGSGWNFLLWGALMGLYQIGERLFYLWRPVISLDKQPLWWQGVAMSIIMLLTLFTGVFLEMDVPIALRYLRGIVIWDDGTLPNSRIFVMIIPALWLDIIQYRSQDELVFLTWPRLAQAAILALAFLAIFLASRVSLGTPFIYQGF